MPREPAAASASRIIGLLDVGTSKVACLIAKIGSGHRREKTSASILGLGHRPSSGVRAGVIVDLDKAEQAIRAAVAEAEDRAGTMIDDVLLSLTGGRLRSLRFSATTRVKNGVVTGGDIARLAAEGWSHAGRRGEAVVQLNRVGYRLDGADVEEPAGLAARHLSLDLHAVVADEAPLCNLRAVVERCHLKVAGFVPAPAASALAAASDEERDRGVACIDIGAGTTTLAAFARGRLVFADAMPVGGDHITYDIARTLRTPLAEAERIKAVYGSLIEARSDASEAISYAPALDGAGRTEQTTQAGLTALVRRRMAAMLGVIGERLAKGDVEALAGNCVVLTGGTAALIGAAEFAASALGRPVRVGRPRTAPMGYTSDTWGPAFATVAGLLVAATEGPAHGRLRPALEPGYLQRVGEWMRSGF